MNFILIGHPQHRRTLLLQQAFTQANLANFRVISYHDILDDVSILAKINKPNNIIKLDAPNDIEQPYKHSHSQKISLPDRLITSGWQIHKSKHDSKKPLPLAYGQLAYQHWWFTGFASLLARIEKSLPYVRWFNHPQDILLLIDKWRCQQYLAQHLCANNGFHHISIPEPLGLIQNADALNDLLTQRFAHKSLQVFIKPRYGASAAGVMAYRRHKNGQQVLYSTTELSNHKRMFNTLKPQKITDSAHITQLINAIAQQGAYVEKWIPKPRAGNLGHYDVRMVAFCGQIRQRIARISHTPMTNLHLGNTRMPLNKLLSADKIQQTEQKLAQVAHLFPRSLSIGFDVMIKNHACHIIEANAFGDLLPNLTWQNNTTWQDQADWFGRYKNTARV